MIEFPADLDASRVAAWLRSLPVIVPYRKASGETGHIFTRQAVATLADMIDPPSIA